MSRLLLTIGCCAVLISAAEGFDQVIDLPPANSISGIESNTQVNVLEGADLNGLTIPTGLSGVEVNVLGGIIRNGIQGQNADRLTIAGGSVGVGAFPGTVGRSVLVTGGTTGLLTANQDLSIEGGSIELVFAENGIVTDISGGSIDQLRAGGASDTTIRGGRIGHLDVRAGSGSTILRGSDFRLNGQVVTGPITVGTSSTNQNFVFTGVLEDGSSVIYSGRDLNQFADRLDSVEFDLVPVPFATPLIDLASDPVPNGLRSGQTLIAHAGDQLGNNFHSYKASINLGAGSLGQYAKVVDGDVLLDGGVIGENLSLYDSRLTVRGGSVGDRLIAAADSTILVQGGIIGDSMRVIDSQLVVSGGKIESTFMNPGGISAIDSEILISGGEIDAITSSGSSVTMTGGQLILASGGMDFDISGGHVREIFAAGQITLRGGRIGKLTGEAELFGEFKVNGVPVSGPTILSSSSVLTGVLSDGSTIVLSQLLGDSRSTWELNTVPVPSVGPSLIIAPVDPIPNGLRDGQTLTLAPGSDTGADFVSVQANLNVAGGTLGEDATVVGGVTTISAGTVGSRLSALAGANVVMTGGTIGEERSGGQMTDTKILKGSTLTVLGGVIHDTTQIDGTSTLDVYGGQLGWVEPSPGSSVTISGDAVVGSISDFFALDGSSGRTSVVIDGGTTSGVSLREQADLAIRGGTVGSASVRDNATAQVSGGQLGGLSAGNNGNVLMTGGTVSGTVSASSTVAEKPAVLVVDGGQIGNVRAGRSGQIAINNGVVVTGSLSAESASSSVRALIEINGGEVQSLGLPGVNRIEGGGIVRLTDGSVRLGFEVGLFSSGPEAIVDVSGGVFGRENRVDSGNTMRLRGGEFLLNGVPISGQVDVSDDYTLTGTLTDGSVVVLASATGDEFDPGTLELINEPIPAVSPLVINSPADPTPRGLRAGQTLNLGAGANLGQHFAAVGATLNVAGGEIGDGLELVETQATISAGAIGESVILHTGSTLTLAGGDVGRDAVFSAGSVANLSAGRLGSNATFQVGSELSMTGGLLGPEANLSGNATIRGGVLGRGFITRPGATLELVGSDFRLSDEAVEGGQSVPTAGLVLSGVLADGTPVILGPSSNFFGEGDSVSVPVLLTAADPPAPASTIINAPIDPTPLGVRPDQTLNLGTGATTIDDFAVLRGTLNVNGGEVGARLEALGASIDLTEGVIGSNATLFQGTVMTVRGGEVSDGLEIQPLSVVSQIGGTLGGLRVQNGAVVNVAGGEFNGQATDLFGRDFWSVDGSEVNLFGPAFFQEGSELTAGLVFGESVEVTSKQFDLTGVLAEGSDIELVAGGRSRQIAGGTITLTKLLLGDFNHDGLVDAADYTLWRDTLGQVVELGTGADHDFDGVVTHADREVWAARFGTTVESLLAAGASVVPEPTALVLSLVLAASTIAVRRRSGF